MKYYVITPEYETVIPVLDYGEGPSELGRDAVVVDAPNKRQAKILGLRELKKISRGWVNWGRDQASNPFTGLRVEVYEEEAPCQRSRSPFLVVTAGTRGQRALRREITSVEAGCSLAPTWRLVNAPSRSPALTAATSPALSVLQRKRWK